MVYTQELYQKNKESIIAAKKRYYQKNREKILRKQKEYDQTHREERKQKYLAKKLINQTTD